MNVPDSVKLSEMDEKISDFERVISALGGGYLLYDSLKNNRSIPEIAAAGFMIFRGVTGYCPIGDAVSRITNKPRKAHNSNINIHNRLIVNKPVGEVYKFWRNLGNLSLFMSHIKNVTIVDESISEWKAKLPGGVGTIDWRAQIVGEEPNRYIGWSSLPGSSVKNTGKVEFKDAGELGTLVHIAISYQAPMGTAGENIAKLLNPVFEKIVRNDIMGFKRYIETGTTDKISQEMVNIHSY